MQFSCRFQTLSIVLLTCFLFTLSFKIHSQVQDMDFGDGGRKIVNNNLYDYGRGAIVHSNRLLVGNSEYNSLPLVSAFTNEGEQDFTFGSGGDIEAIGELLYADDGIYAGNKLQMSGFKAKVQKFSYDGQLISSFGNGGLLETVLTTSTPFVWFDDFNGLKQWGNDIVWLGSYLDTLCVVKMSSGGSLDNGFDGDGALRCKVANYIDGLNSFDVNSWFLVENKLYVSMDFYNSEDGEMQHKIFPINEDGSIDTDGITDVTSLNASSFFVNDETIYLETDSGIKRCSGTTFTIDSSFGNGGLLQNNTGWGADYSFGPDGYIYLHGSIGTSPQMGYCGRFTPNGIADTSFGNNGYVTLPALHTGDQVFIRDIAVNDEELYLIGESGIYGVTSGGSADIFITRFTDIQSNPVTVSEKYQSEQLLYPNPAKDRLNFSTKASNEWKIIDATGRLVHSGNSMNEGVQSIDISMLSNGIYLLRSGYSSSYYQFIKQ